MCNNPSIDLINAYAKFGQNLCASTQDTEQKRNSVINQGS